MKAQICTQIFLSADLKAVEAAILYTIIFSILLINSSTADSGQILAKVEAVGDDMSKLGQDLKSEPYIKYSNIQAELVFEGSMNPTSMVFLEENDILLLELVNGTVFRVLNGVLQPDPVLDVNVSRVTGERGMLGIAESKGPQGQTYVFLYYTEAIVDGGTPIGNRLYRYEFVDNKLVNPKLILDLPAFPGPYHNGGAITVGPDGNIYVPIGDLLDWATIPNSTQAQNVQNGSNPNGSGGILRVKGDGNPVDNGVLGNVYPLILYYAYGIRNSFGIDFDPISGTLWDTENGPGYGDEINLVEPGFNSGWRKVQGIWNNSENNHIGNVIEGVPQGLVDFNEKGKYREPEFTWKTRGIGPTALKFLDSDKLGKEYENDMFVGDVHNGNLYHFDLNENRTGLLLSGVLKDKVAENEVELEDVTIGQGFNGGITDIEVGEDGYLYIVSGIWGDIGRIYRLIPSTK